VQEKFLKGDCSSDRPGIQLDKIPELQAQIIHDWRDSIISNTIFTQKETAIIEEEIAQ
jgi:hypothetical protein